MPKRNPLNLSFSSLVHDQPKHINMSFGQTPGSTFNWQSTLTQFSHSSPEYVKESIRADTSEGRPEGKEKKERIFHS